MGRVIDSQHMEISRLRVGDPVIFRNDYQTAVPAGTRGRVVDVFRSRYDRELLFSIETEEGQECVVAESDVVDELTSDA